MKIHRFYVPDLVLTNNIWIHDKQLLHQWTNVLRFKTGNELVIFDGIKNDNLYKIIEIKKDEINLELVTEYHRQLPKREIYLFWSLLKKDKNNWVLQKCTELGVSHFIPILADRSEKTGFNIERSQKIVIEAVEQCGRSDVPKIREPLSITNAIKQYNSDIKLFYADKSDLENSTSLSDNYKSGVFVGPEGGWTPEELKIFKENGVEPFNVNQFTLRAETASLISVTKLLQ